MALSPSDFGKAVVAAGLLPADDLRALLASSADARPKDVTALAKLLVERGTLTRYQTDELLAGRGPGLVLGDYIVRDKIGAGGMGQVLKAEHRKMGRTVALKLMSPSAMKDEAAIKRFHREVRAAARLEHVNIVTAHAAGEANGMHYLVMQHVEGSDLSGRVKKEGPLSVDLAMDCICQSARGLAYAHSEGIIHRDIKPANLLLDKKGVVKILDMGLARIDGGDTHDGLTGTEQVLGTVDYMSPEQAISTRDCDARSDIYSLGCTLWYLLTGAKMYSGDSAIQRLMQHREAPLPSLLAARDDIPWALEKLFHKMVAKQPGDRCQTMDEVVQEIEHIRGGSESSRTSALNEDTNLGDFFKTLGGKESSRLGTKVKAAAGRSPAEDGDTLAHSDSLEVHKSTGGLNPPWNNPKILLGAGAAAILLLLLGVWVIVRDKDGKPVAKVNVPDGGSVEVKSGQADQNKTATKSAPTIASVASPLSQPNSIKGDGAKAFNSPAFQQWMKVVQALPAEKQIEAVAKKLVELNPAFDGEVTGDVGKGTPKIEGGVVTELGFATDNVTDISPIRALVGLKAQYCGGSRQGKGRLVDLSPLQGTKLARLDFGNTQVSDLSPLQGMPLTLVSMHNTQVSDLSPLKGMRLTVLYCGNTPVTDLSGLRGTNLTRLELNGTKVFDLSPLQGMNLTQFAFEPRKVTQGLDVIRQMKSLNRIGIGGVTGWFSSDEFWKKYDAGEFGKPITTINDPAFQVWMKTVAALPAEKQVEAVSKKLMELNPGFDGKMAGFYREATPLIENGVVTRVGFVTDNATDISPIRALVGLKYLYCAGSSPNKGRLSDLSPIHGMKLNSLYCIYTPVSDLSPLEGMPLTYLSCMSTTVSDLAPVKGMPLATLWCDRTLVTDLSTIQGMPLTFLSCAQTQVSDLLPLKGIPLSNLLCSNTRVSDLSPLTGMTTLGSLDVRGTKVTVAGVAALRKALPGCLIEWDGPVKPITNINDPAFQQWMKTVAALPAEKQVDAVSKKLVELNPGFDGKVTGSDGKGAPKIEAGVVMGIGFLTDKVTDISPVRALVGMKRLWCYCGNLGTSRLSDLSPLQGMQLEFLSLLNAPLSDLSSLKGMPLTRLYFHGTQVSDLSPLRGMKLTNLGCGSTPVSDLSPLKEMPLLYLDCSDSLVTDLSPLESCKSLGGVIITKTKVTPTTVVALQKALPNCKIEWDGATSAAPAGEGVKPTAPQPASNVDPDRRAAQWVLEKGGGIGIVVDGTLKYINDELLPGISADKVLPKGHFQLQRVILIHKRDLVDADLTHLTGLANVASVQLHGTSVTAVGLHHLRTLPKLTRLAFGNGPLDDAALTALSQLKQLTFLELLAGTKITPDHVQSLQALPNLIYLNLGYNELDTATFVRIGELTKLKSLGLVASRFNESDLEKLKTLPDLDELTCSNTQLSDAGLIRLGTFKKLQRLRAKGTKITPAGVAALQTDLPNCKIEWDGATPASPAGEGVKPKTPLPVGSGTK